MDAASEDEPEHEPVEHTSTHPVANIYIADSMKITGDGEISEDEKVFPDTIARLLVHH